MPSRTDTPRTRRRAQAAEPARSNGRRLVIWLVCLVAAVAVVVRSTLGEITQDTNAQIVTVQIYEVEMEWARPVVSVRWDCGLAVPCTDRLGWSDDRWWTTESRSRSPLPRADWPEPGDLWRVQVTGGEVSTLDGPWWVPLAMLVPLFGVPLYRFAPMRPQRRQPMQGRRRAQW
jgi:hypothetical protein